MVRHGLIVVLVVAIVSDVLAASAGRVQFVAGQVTAETPDGTARALKKGDSVEEGEAVVTGADGQAQLVMIDEALVAVRPNTRLRFETYQYAGKQDGTESAVMALLRGGFRTLTGIIGKAKRSAYRINTPTATIGIRGTDHEPLYIPPPAPGETPPGPPGTYNKVNSGETYIENANGRIELGPNQAGFASATPGVAPVKLPKLPEFMRGPTAMVGKAGDKRSTPEGTRQGQQDQPGQKGQQGSPGPGQQGQQGTPGPGQQGLQSMPGQGQTGQQVPLGPGPQAPGVGQQQPSLLLPPGGQMPSGGIPGGAIPGGAPFPGALPPPLPPPIKGSFDPANPVVNLVAAPNGFSAMGGDLSGISVGSGAGVVGNNFAVMRDASGNIASVGSSNFAYDSGGAPLAQSNSAALGSTAVNWGIYSGGQINDSMGLRNVSFFHFMGAPNTTSSSVLSAVLASPMTFNAAVANNEYTKPIAENKAIGGTVSLSITLANVSSTPSVTAYNLNVGDANARNWTASLSGGPVGLGTFLTGTGASLSVNCAGCVVGTGAGTAHGAPIGTTTVNGVISSYDLKAGAAGVTGSVLAR